MAVEQEHLGVVREASDDPAWERVVSLERTAGSRLCGYAVHLGVDGPRANDLVQDALLRLWRELRRGIVIRSPEPWLFRTVSRLAMDEHCFHRRVLRLMTSLGERSSPTAMEVETTERAALWSVVDQLPPRQRQVLFLRFRADLTYEEVAQVMGITPAAVRSHSSQALVTLRARLGAEEGGR